jgi:amidohydrolase
MGAFALVCPGFRTMEVMLTPIHDRLVDLRRHFYQYPEVAVPFRDGIGKTSLVAALSARKPGATVAVRADMDALCRWRNGIRFPTVPKHPGVMRACGHDGHMAIMLGVVRALVGSDWKETGAGRVLFLFQPTEEGRAGARAMLDDGVLDEEDVEAMFTGHMYPELATGQLAFAPEVSNAASDKRIKATLLPEFTDSSTATFPKTTYSSSGVCR